MSIIPSPGDHPAQRFGNVAVSIGDKVILWGGHYHHSRVVWIYEMQKRIWRGRATGRLHAPPSLSGSSGAIVDFTLFIIGGISISSDYVNTVYSLDLNTWEWSKVASLEPKHLSPRDKFGCWVTGKTIVCFGGYGDPPSNHTGTFRSGEFIFNNEWHGWNNDFLSFDTKSYMWTPLLQKGAVPSPRAAHACTNFGNTEGYLYGGRSGKERLNDLYSISFHSNAWCKILPSGHIPQGRSWHSLTAIDDMYLFLFGGLNTNFETLNDMWLFDIKLNKWREIHVDKRQQKRMWHTSCLGRDYGEILVLGGCAQYPDVCADDHTVVLYLTPPSLKVLVLNTIKNHPKLCGSWENLPSQLKSDIQSVFN